MNSFNKSILSTWYVPSILKGARDIAVEDTKCSLHEVCKVNIVIVYLSTPNQGHPGDPSCSSVSAAN